MAAIQLALQIWYVCQQVSKARWTVSHLPNLCNDVIGTSLSLK